MDFDYVSGPFDPTLPIQGKHGDEFLPALKKVRSLLHAQAKSNPTDIRTITIDLKRAKFDFVKKTVHQFAEHFGIFSKDGYYGYRDSIGYIKLTGEELLITCFTQILPFIIKEVHGQNIERQKMTAVNDEINKINEQIHEHQKHIAELQVEKETVDSKLLVLKTQVHKDRERFIRETASELFTTQRGKKRRTNEDCFFDKKAYTKIDQ
jgi:hypothetical protein